MIRAIRHEIHAGCAILICLISVSVCLGCSQKTESQIEPNVTEAHSYGRADACINVSGYVLGDIIVNSSVYLYQIPGLVFGKVMKTVRTGEPKEIGRVNDSAGFNFSCLSYGKYVVSIPSKSFANSSVGSPLPYEFETSNVSLNIVFHGGDNRYLVSAFTIDLI